MTDVKPVIFGEEARQKIIEGVDILARAVTVTLSPKGRNVAIARPWNSPIVLHDGVSVAKAVNSLDKYERMGIDIAREAAQKTVDECGDGTTTSILLLSELINRAHKLLKADPKLSPMTLRDEIFEALELAKKHLKDMARPISGVEDLKRIGKISSANEEIGDIVAEAIVKMGADGQITAEDSMTMKTYVDYTEGYVVDSGFIVPHMVTNPNRMEATIENPLVAVIDKLITLNTEIVPLVESMLKINKNIVIFGDLDGDALGTLVKNKLRGNINVLVVRPPSYGERRQNFLADIALVTGATVFSKELALDAEAFAEEFTTEWLGGAKKIVASKDRTIIINGKGNADAVTLETNRLRELKDNANDIFQREIVEERLAKLTTGVAVIKVGAKTEVENREKIERVKDAIGAVRAATEEGIVAGGGKAFLNLQKYLMYHGKKTVGKSLLMEVLEQPSLKVMQNSGESPERSAELLKEMRFARNKNKGYDVTKARNVDLIAEGVIDPAKVIRVSLENAVSVGTSLLSTEVLINTVEEQKEE